MDITLGLSRQPMARIIAFACIAKSLIGSDCGYNLVAADVDNHYVGSDINVSLCSSIKRPAYSGPESSSLNNGDQSCVGFAQNSQGFGALKDDYFHAGSFAFSAAARPLGPPPI